MKKWQIAAVGAALLVAVAGAVAGAMGPSLAGPPQPPAPIVTLPATVVVANPAWQPPAQVSRPDKLPLAPTLPAATGPVLFSADFAAPDSSAWHSPLLPESDLAPLWHIADGTVQLLGHV